MQTVTETSNPESTIPAAPMPADPGGVVTLRILGTPLPAWLPLAAALQQALGSTWPGGPSNVRLEPQACWELDSQAPGSAGWLQLVFVDNPGRALSHWLAEGAPGSVEQAQASWRDGAQRLLRQAHRRPGSFLFVDAAEAEAAPDGLLRTLKEGLASPVAFAPLDSAGVSCDPLLAVLGSRLAGADTESSALFAELQMTCVELDTNALAAPDMVPAEAALTQRALNRYRRLEGLETERAGLVAMATELQRKLDQDRNLQLARQNEIDRLTQESMAFRAAGTEYQQESELALGQMHRMQGEIESIAEQKRAVEGRLADALTQNERLADDFNLQSAQLAALRQTFAVVEAQTNGLRAELDDSQQRAAELRVELNHSQQHAQDSAAQLEEARREGRALLQQLHQLQQELQEMHRIQCEFESVAGQKRAVEGRLANALTQNERLAGDFELQAAQLSALRQTSAMLETQAVGLRAELSDSQLLAAELRLRAEQVELAKGVAGQQAQDSAAQLEEARHEGRTLLHQLHQLQQELQEQFLRFKALEDRAYAFGVRAGGVSAYAAEVQLTDVRDAPPHRQLQFALSDFRAAGRVCLQLIVRLVEHEGRPGLVLFSTTTEVEAVAAWASSAEEDGRAFMLLVPTDTHGSQLLHRMGATDWLLLLGLCNLLQQEVQSRAGVLEPHWPAVAGRLCRQLEADAPRFRYDSLDLAAAPPTAAGEAAMDITFGNAMHGLRPVGHVHLRWLTNAATGTANLNWMLPTDAVMLPLACWPLDPHGLPQESWALPVGRGWARQEKRRQWSALAPGEREMLLAVIDQLPAVAARAADAELPAGSSRAALVDQAQSLRKDARQTLTGMQVRAAVRRIVRGESHGA